MEAFLRVVGSRGCLNRLDFVRKVLERGVHRGVSEICLLMDVAFRMCLTVEGEMGRGIG